MLVDGLPFVVVCWGGAPVGSGNRLGSFVGLEPLIQYSSGGGPFRISGALIRQHQVVVGLEVFWVDLEHFLECRDRFIELALKELQTTDLP